MGKSLLSQEEGSHGEATLKRVVIETAVSPERKGMSASERESRNARIQRGEIWPSDCPYLTYEQVRRFLEKLNEEKEAGERLGSMSSYDLTKSLCERWGELSPKKALQDIRAMNKVNFSGTYSIFVGWASKNPEAAFAYYLNEYRENSPPKERLFILEYMVERVAGHYSPDSIWEVLSRASKRERRDAIPHLLRGVAETQPERVKEFVEKIGEEAFESGEWGHWYNYEDILENWKSKGDQFYEETLALFPEKVVFEIRKEEFSKTVKENPELTGKMISEMTEDRQREMFLDLRYSYPEYKNRDFRSYIDWVGRHATEKVARQVILDEASRAWGDSYSAKEKWVAGFPPGELKDQAVHALSNGYPPDRYDEGGMAVMASEVSDRNLREKSLENVMRRWMDCEPDEVLKWLDNAPVLSEEETQFWRKEAVKVQSFMK